MATKEKPENVISQLHSIETKLDEVLREMQKNEHTAFLRSNRAQIYTGGGFTIAAVGLLLTGFIPWFSIMVSLYGIALGITAEYARRKKIEF